MEVALARNWWSLVIRGLVAIALGIVTFAWPGITIGALVLLFGAYALDRWRRQHRGCVEGRAGARALGRAYFRRHRRYCRRGRDGHLPRDHRSRVRVPHRRLGSGDRSARDCRCRSPAPIHSHEWLLALSGVASLLFGILALLLPLAGAVAIALGIGIYALVFGVLLIGLGFRLRSWTRTPHAGQTFPLPAR